jgi:lipopolysaccharide transport system permease protein
VSKVLSGLVKFLIQFVLFVLFLIYYTFVTHTVHPNWHIVFFPLFLLVMAALGLGIGLFVTSMTTKYRDLTFLIAFGVQLGMYATPVIYPLSKFHQYRKYLLFNPLTSLFEAFKFAFLGRGFLSYTWLLYSLTFTVLILIFGILTFNKVEKRFIDTV